MNPRITTIFCLVLTIMGLTTCAVHKDRIPAAPLGSWLVYWDGERGLKELETHGRLFERVSLFAYELGPDGQPQPAPGLKEIIPRFLNLSGVHGFSPWLTLVNDWRAPERVFLKETDRLRQLLSDPARRENHIRSIVELIRNDGFAGLDLDYEGFSSADAPLLTSLVKGLAEALKKNGMGFQVVVEPQMKRFLPPPETAPLVVMGYNLHGPHSGPGPRATPDFIRSLIVRGKGDDQGKPTLALAVGGFSWGPDGKVKQLDWETGYKLAEKALKKGRGSGEVPFAEGAQRLTVWYEDEQSLEAKWEAASEAGFRGLMVWRLGGNDDRLFRWLNTIKK